MYLLSSTRRLIIFISFVIVFVRSVCLIRTLRSVRFASRFGFAHRIAYHTIPYRIRVAVRSGLPPRRAASPSSRLSRFRSLAVWLSSLPRFGTPPLAALISSSPSRSVLSRHRILSSRVQPSVTYCCTASSSRFHLRLRLRLASIEYSPPLQTDAGRFSHPSAFRVRAARRS